MKLKRSMFKMLFIVTALNLPAIFGSASCQAQPNMPADKPQTATATEQLESTAAASTKATDSTKDAPDLAAFTQNNDSMSLEERISAFNKQFCPPEERITDISEFSLIRLVKAELIKRAELEKFKNMVLINGKVYVKNENPPTKPDPQTDPKPAGKAGKNLFGDLEATCEELAQKKNRGESEGNKRPDQILELKRRRITYRDRDNQLREMEIYSPPRFPAKKREISGKRGKKVKDYATSILVPKNQQGDTKDITAFDDMPSADAWVDDNVGK